MTYKHFYRAILFRLTVIVFLAGLTVWLFFERQNYPLSIVSFLFLAGAVINIIRYFNRLNRWVSFFLLGIENDDTTLKVPSASGNKAIDDVYRGMQRLNELFRQTKTEINTQEQYFRSVMNQSSTGLFSVNDKGRVLNINPEAEKLTGLKEYHHLNGLTSVNRSLPRFILRSHNTSAVFENRYGQKLLFKLSEITIKNKNIKLVAVSDITKELDNREVDAWIKLARTLSHEIMNNIAPITTLSKVISGYFTQNNTVVDAGKIDEKTIRNTVKGLNVIEERSAGLMNFVENYRKFTKLPEPHLKPVNVSALLESNLLAARAFPVFDTIRIKKSIPDSLFFTTDEQLLSQVIINLLKNANEALSLGKTENPTLVVNLRETAHTLQIELENNGPAIPPELRAQIFVPFFTTKEGGSGIGLSLSKQIMLKMGGDVILASPKNGRTSFRVVLNKSD